VYPLSGGVNVASHLHASVQQTPVQEPYLLVQSNALVSPVNERHEKAAEKEKSATLFKKMKTQKTNTEVPNMNGILSSKSNTTSGQRLSAHEAIGYSSKITLHAMDNA